MRFYSLLSEGIFTFSNLLVVHNVSNGHFNHLRLFQIQVAVWASSQFKPVAQGHTRKYPHNLKPPQMISILSVILLREEPITHSLSNQHLIKLGTAESKASKWSS